MSSTTCSLSSRQISKSLKRLLLIQTQKTKSASLWRTTAQVSRTIKAMFTRRKFQAGCSKTATCILQVSRRTCSAKSCSTRTLRCPMSRRCFPSRSTWCSTTCTLSPLRMAWWLSALLTATEKSLWQLCFTSQFSSDLLLYEH